MHRILDAAEALMENASFENISVLTIMERASVRPGSFYARFPDKLSLLGVLYERYATDVEAIVDRELPRLDALGPAARIRGIIGLVGRIYRTRRGVARSAALHFWNGGEESALLNRLGSRQARLMNRIGEAFAAAADEISAGGSSESTAFALKIIMTSSREQYLFAHQARTLRIPDADFESRLGDMIVGYLNRGSQ